MADLVFSHAAVAPFSGIFDGDLEYLAYFFGGMQYGFDEMNGYYRFSRPDDFEPSDARFRGGGWTLSQACYYYTFGDDEFSPDNFLIHNFDWDETLVLMPGEIVLESYGGAACSFGSFIYWLMGPNNLAPGSAPNDNQYGKWFMRFQPSTLSSDPLDDMNESRRANHPYGIDQNAWMAYLDVDDGFIFVGSQGRETTLDDVLYYFTVYDVDDNSWADVDISAFTASELNTGLSLLGMCSFENVLYTFWNDDGTKVLWQYDGAVWEQLAQPVFISSENLVGMSGFIDPFGWRKLMLVGLDTLIYNIDTDVWEILDSGSPPSVVEGLTRIRPAGNRYTD